jgi:hypothetical protein
MSSYGTYKKVEPIQKEWLRWILHDKQLWLNQHIGAPENLKRMRWAQVNGIYDVITEHLLNYVLKMFNKDEDIKNLWKIHLFHKQQNNI